MAIEPYVWVAKEAAPEEIKPSATIYSPTPIKWYDVIIRPPYIYFILIGIGLYFVFHYYVRKR